MKTRSLLTAALLIGSVLALSAPANALTLSPNLVNENPSGLSAAFKADVPWLVVTFTDNGANIVHVKIESQLTTVGAFTSQVDWNSSVGTAFTFSASKVTGGAFVIDKAPAFSLNGFNADGATNGKGTGFDFEVQFSTKSGSTNRFDGVLDTLEFDITCTASCTGFNANSFDAFNPQAASAFFRLDGTQIPATQPCPGGPGLCYRIAAHIQGLTGGELGSIWIAGVGPESVPEPNALLLLGGAIVGLAGLARSKFRR